MAIDFMIMPLSRYLAGDFVTPVMRMSWEIGTSYYIIGPQGRRELPPNVPYGGSDAPEKWVTFAPMVAADLVQLFPALPWDERSTAEPQFHRVDPRSFEALLDHAKSLLKPPSWFAKLLGKSRGSGTEATHLLSTVFLPVEIDVVQIESPFAAICGSATMALRALGGDVPESAVSARDTLRDALRDAVELRLPMVVDT